MSNSALTDADVAAILKLLTTADHLDEFRIRYGEIEISYSKSGGASIAPMMSAGPPVAPVPVATPAVAVAPRASLPSTSAPAATGASTASTPGPKPVVMEGVAVTSPMFGTFYRAPAPGAAPFVEVGQQVEPDTVVCIIEVMKLMNSVTAGVGGTVRQILPADSEPVELGQALVVIQPAA